MHEVPKVLVTFRGYGPGVNAGANRMAWRTSLRLAGRGCDVAVITDASVPDALAREFGDLTLGPPAPGWRPDVVHVYDLAQPQAAETGQEWAHRHGVPLAVTPASTTDVWPDPDLGRRCVAGADVVFVMNAKEAAQMRTIAHPDAVIRHIPQAPDLIGTPDPTRFRKRHGITGPIVLFLGRRVPSKGHTVLLEAAPLVWSHLPEVAFVFAGPGGDDDITARGDRRLFDLGPLDEHTKHDALAAADVLCLPSGADLFPLVFAEAWACGRPVVSGDFPGVGDVVREGVDGVVVSRTPTAVAKALRQLLTDEPLRRRLGAAGRRRVTETMSWDLVANVVTDGYRAAYALRGAGSQP